MPNKKDQPDKKRSEASLEREELENEGYQGLLESVDISDLHMVYVAFIPRLVIDCFEHKFIPVPDLDSNLFRPWQTFIGTRTTTYKPFRMRLLGLLPRLAIAHDPSFVSKLDQYWEIGKRKNYNNIVHLPPNDELNYGERSMTLDIRRYHMTEVPSITPNEVRLNVEKIEAMLGGEETIAPDLKAKHSKWKKLFKEKNTKSQHSLFVVDQVLWAEKLIIITKTPKNEDEDKIYGNKWRDQVIGYRLAEYEIWDRDGSLFFPVRYHSDVHFNGVYDHPYVESVDFEAGEQMDEMNDNLKVTDKWRRGKDDECSDSDIVPFDIETKTEPVMRHVPWPQLMVKDFLKVPVMQYKRTPRRNRSRHGSHSSSASNS